MNIALEKTEEFVNGKLRRSYGDAFVRGNNGLCLPFPIAFDYLCGQMLTSLIVLYISAS